MSTRTAIVTGASRGFGRATAIALVNAGVHVIGVGRDREQLDAVRDEAGAEFTAVAADAADPVTAGRLVHVNGTALHQASHIPGSSGFLPKEATQRSRGALSPGHSSKMGQVIRVCY